MGKIIKREEGNDIGELLAVKCPKCNKELEDWDFDDAYSPEGLEGTSACCDMSFTVGTKIFYLVIEERDY